MKKQILWALGLMVLVLTMNSCGPAEPTFSQSDLYKDGGLWQQEGTRAFVRFTTENANNGFLWGKEWNEAEKDSEEKVDEHPHGNGWLKYQLVQKELTEFIMMSNDGAEIEKHYVVSVLTNDRLEYYRKGDDSKKMTKFNKVIEVKE